MAVVRKVSAFTLSFAVLCSMPLCGCAHRPQASVTQSQKPTQPEHQPESIVGSRIQTLYGTLPSGKPIAIDLSRRTSKTLLLVLSPDCLFCRVNFHNWRQLQAEIPSRNIMWLDITATAGTDYMSNVGIPAGATLIYPSRKNKQLLGVLSGTPATVLLDRDGKVEWEWSGMLNKAQMRELHSLFDR